MSWQWILSLVLAAGYALAFIAVLHALLRARQPQSALGWVAAILTLPLLGSMAYFIFGINRVDSRAAKLMSDTAERRMKALKASGILSGGRVPPTLFAPDTCEIMRVGEGKPGSFRRLGCNHFTPLFNGDEAYPRMLEAIASARHEVFLCTYIFQGRVYGKAFADALLAAHRRGVDVRVLVDGMGTLPGFHKPWKRLQREGVPVHRFIPPHLLPPQMSVNLRNHRKVLVCDGEGFTGGMNIDDVHVMASRTREHVQDVHFLCEGPIVGELREAFLMDWAFVTGQDDTGRLYLPCVAGAMDGRVVMDGPGTPNDPVQDLLCGVISCARRRITVMTPYFLPPRELTSALVSAAARGVEVRVILPAVLDHAYVEWASDHTIPPLLENGVRIFRQPAPFAHTKLLLVDDIYVCLGSTNLDPRSLSLNFELNVEVFSPELNARLHEFAASVLAVSHEVTLENLLSRPLAVRLRNAAAWIFSPYL